jgi:hypothetical protein
MSQSIAADIIPLFGPSDADWIVTLVTKGGKISSRRVTPSTIDEESAVRVAMNASEMKLADLDCYSVRRAADRSLVTNGDDFLASLRAKKRN